MQTVNRRNRTLNSMATPDGPQDDERSLCEAVLSGQESAWQVLFERHFDGLLAFVASRSGRKGDSIDDIIQDVWMVAVRRIGDFDPDRGSFSAWLKGIALNAMRNHARRRARESPPGNATLELVCNAGGEASVDQMEIIRIAAAGLPPRYRAVLAAKYEEQLSVLAISQRFGESEKAIESLLSRARAAFRSRYRQLSAGEES
jgi:RNA polymerase sigma-70 factor (ECF subfamily)